MTVKMAPNSVKIGGLSLSSRSLSDLLRKVLDCHRTGKKTLIFTPNPEFVVLASHQAWFKKVLNQADLSLPDGFGLVLASRFLKTEPRLRKAVSGADLVISLLSVADINRWRVGIVGARKGDKPERRVLVKRLRKRFPRVGFFALEDRAGWEKEKWDFILACQGMGEQEKWLVNHFDKVRGVLFMGAGGSLDYLTGFALRAPLGLRKLGLEWLWRFIQRPRVHGKRLFQALVIFPLLVIKEKTRS